MSHLKHESTGILLFKLILFLVLHMFLLQTAHTDNLFTSQGEIGKLQIDAIKNITLQLEGATVHTAP